MGGSARGAVPIVAYRRALNKACTLLLAVAGGEPSDAAAFREHAAENCDAAVASRIGGLQSTANFGDG